MEPIRPIGPRPQEIPAIEPVQREGERQREREQQRKKRQQHPARHTPEPPEDDGLPHIDVSV
jgi:hypothetical protein